MATVNLLIQRAYRLANIVGRTDSPSAEQTEDGLNSLNELLNHLRGKEDIDMGLYNVTVDTEIPDDDFRALRYLLAVELSGELGMDTDPIVVRESLLLKDQLSEVQIPEIELEHGLRPRTTWSFNVTTGR